jgi:hypothetical protein
MSRSKHTDPPSIRASRRVRAPFQTRSAADLSLRRTLGLKFTGSAGAVSANKKTSWHPASRPRIIWRQPRPGFHHPVTKQAVLELLQSLGPLAVYGLQSIEFSRPRASHRPASLVFGRYETPGRIFLFEQALPPWRLHGRLSKEDVNRFERAGARVSQIPQSGTALVDWPADTLGRFMLEEVLLHELGHHVLQHHKAKRLARIARSKDHEAFAALFAARQQRVLADRSSSD